MSIFMWGLHYNYSLKFVPCIHLSFLIFVPSELMSVKYQKSISKILKKKKKPNYIYSIKSPQTKDHHAFYLIKN